MTVHVYTTQVFAALKSNRAAHIEDVEARQKTWFDDVDKALKKAYRISKKKGTVFSPGQVLVKLPFPQLSVERYDRVIEKLEFESREVLELDDPTFNAWVHDRWITSGIVIGGGSITYSTSSTGTMLNDAVTTGKLVANGGWSTSVSNHTHSIK